MVKIKDFTLASKNLGGGGMCPLCPTHLVTSRPWLAWNEGSIAYIKQSLISALTL